MVPIDPHEVVTMMAEDSDQSFLRIVRSTQAELVGQLGQDARLLEAEVKAKASTIGSAGLLGLGAFALLATSMALASTALILFLISLGLAPSLAALAVAAASGILGAACLLRMKSLLKEWTPVPHRTLTAVSEDLAALKKAMANVSS